MHYKTLFLRESMQRKRGFFIAFEGTDGCGKSTQLWELAKNIEKKNKYLDILRTHEPWNNEEIKRRLREDKDAYSGALELARLFVDESRVPHVREVIEPRLAEGYALLGDRYAMSTCAYQGTQGMRFDELVALHQGKGILTPDLTLIIDTPVDVCLERMKLRGDSPEKFDNAAFMGQLRASYVGLALLAQRPEQNQYRALFGEVAIIDGNQSINDVAWEIQREFDPVYERWNAEA